MKIASEVKLSIRQLFIEGPFCCVFQEVHLLYTVGYSTTQKNGHILALELPCLALPCQMLALPCLGKRLLCLGKPLPCLAKMPGFVLTQAHQYATLAATVINAGLSHPRSPHAAAGPQHYTRRDS